MGNIQESIRQNLGPLCSTFKRIVPEYAMRKFCTLGPGNAQGYFFQI